MQTTPGLQALAKQIAVATVQQEASESCLVIDQALLSTHDLAPELLEELENERARLQAPDRLERAAEDKKRELLARVRTAPVALPPAPVPPVPKEPWEMVVVKDDRQLFDWHMYHLERHTLQCARISKPSHEFAVLENLPDPHEQGIWRLDRNKFPHACLWDETYANFHADKARVARGWERTPQDWAAECRDVRLSVCAAALGIDKQDLAQRMPTDLDALWSRNPNSEPGGIVCHGPNLVGAGFALDLRPKSHVDKQRDLRWSQVQKR